MHKQKSDKCRPRKQKSDKCHPCKQKRVVKNITSINRREKNVPDAHTGIHSRIR